MHHCIHITHTMFSEKIHLLVIRRLYGNTGVTPSSISISLSRGFITSINNTVFHSDMCKLVIKPFKSSAIMLVAEFTCKSIIHPFLS